MPLQRTGQLIRGGGSDFCDVVKNKPARSGELLETSFLLVLSQSLFVAVNLEVLKRDGL